MQSLAIGNICSWNQRSQMPDQTGIGEQVDLGRWIQLHEDVYIALGRFFAAGCRTEHGRVRNTARRKVGAVVPQGLNRIFKLHHLASYHQTLFSV